MRLIDSTLLVFLSFLLTSPAFAVLHKFEVRVRTITEIEVQSPRIQIQSNGGVGTAVIDETGPAPVFKKLWHIRGAGTGLTIAAPTLSGFIFLRTRDKQGLSSPQTGTGSTADVISWGDVTGWTITGGQFCHSVPATLCDLAVRNDSDTVSPELLSTHYPLGAFVFHGTGYVQDPWLFTTSRGGDLGNSQYMYRGGYAGGGEVPALPLIGIGTVGISIVALGISSARRKRS